jgi:hypothetical protein
MSKSAFVRSLQGVNKPLSPFEVSQRIREQYSCVSTYQGDAKLNIEHYRGYMIRYQEKPHKTPEDPEWYVCVVSLGQSKQWQDIVWTKEILGILDGADQWTHNKKSLANMMDNRTESFHHSAGTPLNVTADKNGLTLALGCAVPLAYRTILRNERFAAKYTPEQLESLLPVPADFIESLLNPQFELDFDRAVDECGQ